MRKISIIKFIHGTFPPTTSFIFNYALALNRVKKIAIQDLRKTFKNLEENLSIK
jgi:hypothetical protein